jgi:hypothetical protein
MGTGSGRPLRRDTSERSHKTSTERARMAPLFNAAQGSPRSAHCVINTAAAKRPAPRGRFRARRRRSRGEAILGPKPMRIRSSGRRLVHRRSRSTWSDRR